jgi:hypothetical protein
LDDANAEADVDASCVAVALDPVPATASFSRDNPLADVSPLVSPADTLVVNLGTTLIGTLTAEDLLRPGRLLVLALVLLVVNSVKLLIS